MDAVEIGLVRACRGMPSRRRLALSSTFSDAEDLSVKRRASLLLGRVSKQDLDPDLGDGVCLWHRV